MKTITLNIKGIHCGCCVKSLTQVLTELDGVQSADVQLEGKANITFDENRVNVAQLIEVIEDAGKLSIKHKRHTLRLLRKKSYSSFN
ncbi:heavy-metal-associated domain-containing protein [Haemophilus influenzae biotype aegyptius]|nr:heavy-metal-associated domain-containing protein [Haemophilus influenzae biotype aegyptius]